MKNSSTTTDAAVRDLLLWMRREGISAHTIQLGDITLQGITGIVRDKDGKPKEERHPTMLEQLAGPDLMGALGGEVEATSRPDQLEPIEEDDEDD